MSAISLIVILVLFAVVAYFVQTSQLSAGWKKLIFIVIAVVIGMLLLSVFGLLDELKSVKVPRL